MHAKEQMKCTLSQDHRARAVGSSASRSEPVPTIILRTRLPSTLARHLQVRALSAAAPDPAHMPHLDAADGGPVRLHDLYVRLGEPLLAQAPHSGRRRSAGRAGYFASRRHQRTPVCPLSGVARWLRVARCHPFAPALHESRQSHAAGSCHVAWHPWHPWQNGAHSCSERRIRNPSSSVSDESGTQAAACRCLQAATPALGRAGSPRR